MFWTNLKGNLCNTKAIPDDFRLSFENFFILLGIDVILFSAILARPRASDRSEVNVPETSPKSALLGINCLLLSKICNSCSFGGRNYTSVDVSGFKLF